MVKSACHVPMAHYDNLLPFAAIGLALVLTGTLTLPVDARVAVAFFPGRTSHCDMTEPHVELRGIESHADLGKYYVTCYYTGLDHYNVYGSAKFFKVQCFGDKSTSGAFRA